MTGSRTALLTLALGTSLLAVHVAPSAATPAPGSAPEPSFEITDEILARSVEEYALDGAVDDLGQPTDEEDVIVLEADILFASREWSLGEAAARAIVDLAEQVPDGASVRVHGHTDSRPMPEGSEVDNQGLSENRAQAVADALSEARGDLDLEVEGFGASEPAVAESADDPGSFAANRRVEIRYGQD